MADRDADEDRHAPGFAREISRRRLPAGGRNRAAAYELALTSGRNYKPGDQISYYIKATPKKVAAYEAAKLATDFDPQESRRKRRLLRREARRAGEEVRRRHC